ncbi:hypothetical protein AVME950_02850 [Acidovorax sp. SUPP950]|uniref:hypothetical protein n=1 Tax=Acidovorax sp. SUPP950 TaxID=511901 RepID=UPI0023BF9E96|nr:hypothetical protein [Acidovorax sp. SUPP950]GKS73788.1 hypothetical protein AVME950_02850 [Acidovorax sp. SUPP950]
MKDFGRGVINALEGVAKLEWFRYPVLKPEQIGFVLPIAVWRFDKNTVDDYLENRLISCLTSLLENYNGNFPWSLSEVGRNWILQPLLIKKLQDSGAFKNEEEVRNHVLNFHSNVMAQAFDDYKAIAGLMEADLKTLSNNN